MPITTTREARARNSILRALVCVIRDISVALHTENFPNIAIMLISHSMEQKPSQQTILCNIWKTHRSDSHGYDVTRQGELIPWSFEFSKNIDYVDGMCAQIWRSSFLMSTLKQTSRFYLRSYQIHVRVRHFGELCNLKFSVPLEPAIRKHPGHETIRRSRWRLPG